MADLNDSFTALSLMLKVLFWTYRLGSLALLAACLVAAVRGRWPVGVTLAGGGLVIVHLLPLVVPEVIDVRRNLVTSTAILTPFETFWALAVLVPFGAMSSGLSRWCRRWWVGAGLFIVATVLVLAWVLPRRPGQHHGSLVALWPGPVDACAQYTDGLVFCTGDQAGGAHEGVYRLDDTRAAAPCLPAAAAQGRCRGSPAQDLATVGRHLLAPAQVHTEAGDVSSFHAPQTTCGTCGPERVVICRRSGISSVCELLGPEVRTGVVPRGPVNLTQVHSLARSIDASPEGSVVLCGLTDEHEARCVLVDAEGALVQHLGVRPDARGFVGARDGVCVVTDTRVECVNWQGEWATRAAFPGAASLTVETTFSCGLFDGAPAVCSGVGAARVESLLALQ